MTAADLVIERSSVFGGLLRSWRVRRRYSQLELALTADMSQRHVSFLEAGRSAPSRAAIERLADALEVPFAERDRLFMAAGFAAQPPDIRWSLEVRQAIDSSLAYILERHEPYPAMIVDRLWNLTGANRAAMTFMDRFGRPPQPNTIATLLDPEGLRPFLVNWREVARRLLDLIEVEVARRLEDPEGRQLLDRLNALPGVAEAIKTVPYRRDGPALSLRLRLGDQELRLFSLVATIGLPAEAGLEELKLETLLPADEATRRWFGEAAMES